MSRETDGIEEPDRRVVKVSKDAPEKNILFKTSVIMKCISQ